MEVLGAPHHGQALSGSTISIAIHAKPQLYAKDWKNLWDDFLFVCSNIPRVSPQQASSLKALHSQSRSIQHVRVNHPRKDFVYVVYR